LCQYERSIIMFEPTDNGVTYSNEPTDPPPGKFIKILDYNIHYEKVGHGDHIIFLTPGAMGSTRTNYDAQLEKFDREKFTLIAWDPPGYGYSRPPERTFPDNYLQRDIEVARHFLKALGVSKMSVIGWCQGGTTAILFAAKYPEMVHKLVVQGAKAYISDVDRGMMDMFRDLNIWPPMLLEMNVKVYGEDYFKTHWLKSMDATRKIHESGGDLCRKELSLVQCPTLVLHGKEDKWIKPNHPEYLTANIKNARYHELSGGHNSHLQYPEEFNKAVQEFLLE